MPNYIQDIMARLVAMEKEALATIAATNNQTPDAVAYWPWEQESFPYFVNRLGAMTVNDTQYSEEIQEYVHTVLMRLVVAHYKEGFDGDAADLAYQYVVAVEDYFREHPRLTTDSGAYTTEADYHFYETRLIGHTGLAVFANAGILAQQYGIEFTLQISYIRNAE